MDEGSVTRRGELRVRPYQPSDKAGWDEFVARCANATFFHRIGWERVVADGLGHRCHYLLAERDGIIEGILPLAEVRSRLFGHTLVSTPGCVYGGIAAATENARLALTDASVRLAVRLRVGLLEMRNRAAVHPDWPTKPHYVTFRRPIAERDEDNLKAIPRKQRAMVRKGIEAGLRTRQTADVDLFFRIYAESVRNLGTPVFPRGFFRALVDEFSAETEISIVEAAGADIAGVLSFYFRDQVLPYYGGSRPVARKVKGNDFMYWDLMTRAARRGARLFDFGRSKVGSGSYDFKKNWGFAPEPLHYECQLVKARVMSENHPNNPKFRLFIEGWKRLPLPIANTVGPWLARNLG